MSHRERVRDFWDEVVSDFLAGAFPLPPPLGRWIPAYEGGIEPLIARLSQSRKEDNRSIAEAERDDVLRVADARRRDAPPLGGLRMRGHQVFVYTARHISEERGGGSGGTSGSGGAGGIARDVAADSWRRMIARTIAIDSASVATPVMKATANHVSLRTISSISSEVSA